MSERVYAIGDIHGRYDLLVKALAAIAEDGGNEGKVVFLGDYINRGPQSRQVVETLMDGPPSSWQWVCLKGNHEAMLAETVLNGLGPDRYGRNGGWNSLLRSYSDEHGFELDDIPAEHIAWCAERPSIHHDEKHVFVHAAVDPHRALGDQSDDDLLWRKVHDREEYSHPAGYIVHGHTPCGDQPVILHGRMNLDIGAFASGRLAIGVFDPSQSLPIGFMIVTDSTHG